MGKSFYDGITFSDSVSHRILAMVGDGSRSNEVGAGSQKLGNFKEPVSLLIECVGSRSKEAGTVSLKSGNMEPYPLHCISYIQIQVATFF